MNWRVFSVGLLFSCSTLSSFAEAPAATPAPVIPVEDLFAPAAIRQVRISPDGQYVAFLADFDGRRGVALMTLATGQSERLIRASDENVDGFRWKGSDRILWWGDVGGNEAAAVQCLNLKTRRNLRIVESYGDNNAERQSGNWGGVLDSWDTNPRKIVIYGSRDESASGAGYYHVDLDNGTRTPINGLKSSDGGKATSRIFDNAGRLRVVALAERDRTIVKARLGKSDSFTTLFELPSDLELAQLGDWGILADNRTFVLTRYGQADRGEIRTIDLDTGREGEALFAAPEGEITDVVFSTDRSKIVGYHYEAEKPRVHWVDPTFASVQAAVDKALPATINRITSWSDDLKKFVVHAGSDRDPGAYLLLDLSRGKPLLMPLGGINPKVDPKQMARVEPISYTARDGLVIHGYLTMPVARTGSKVPLVLFVHGGPYGIRDSWGFDPEVQLLASRGFAVLQVNYRGSGGYGRKFLEAGRFEWGGKMQDDLTDAVHWAIRERAIDKNRVAIMGASYGGYAALAGVTFTPELFRCGVNYVGVSDLELLVVKGENRNPRMGMIFYRKWVHTDNAVLRERSPLRHVERIRVPTFHAYGENDPRVTIDQWKGLKRELDAHGKTYEYFREADEGHGFENTQKQVRFYSAALKFLQENMQPIYDGEVTIGESKVLEMPASETPDSRR